MILAHTRYRLRPQRLHAVKAAPVQQHLRKGWVVRTRGVERAATRPEFGGGRRLQRLWHEGAVSLALVHAGLAGALLVRGDVTTILHAKGGEDLVAEIDVERLPADRLDEA